MKDKSTLILEDNNSEKVCQTIRQNLTNDFVANIT